MRSSPIARLMSVAVVAIGLLLLIAVAAFSYRFTYGNGIALSPGQMEGVTAVCPDGWRAHWGGFSAQFGAAGGAELTGFKTRGNGWRLSATNTAREERGISIESYCQPGRRPLTQRAATAAVEAGSEGSVVAVCRRAETLLAAGFRASNEPGGPRVMVDGMRRVGVRSLEVSGRTSRPEHAAASPPTPIAAADHAP